MELKKPKFSKKEVSQKFNLKDIFGVDFSKNPDLRDQIGQAIIDRIVERTGKGKDIDGDKFTPKYSKAYTKSDDFKDFGKTKKVNMELTGGMLDDIDIISETTNTIKVGFEDDTEIKKAFRHNTGDMGMPKRQFFGVIADDIEAIEKDFKSELKEMKKSPPKEKKQTIGDLVAEAKLLGDLFGES